MQKTSHKPKPAKLVVAAAAAALVAAIAFAAAFAIFNVNVQRIGAGKAAVSSPVSSAVVRYVLSKDSGNRLVLTAVEVKFDADLPPGTYIRVELTDDNDNIVSAGDKTLDSSVSAGTWIRIDLEKALRPPKDTFSSVIVFVSLPQQ